MSASDMVKMDLSHSQNVVGLSLMEEPCRSNLGRLPELLLLLEDGIDWPLEPEEPKTFDEFFPSLFPHQKQG